MSVQKDKRGRVEHKITQYTTGYAFPAAGGILDQPAWLIDIFDIFVAGDRSAAMKELKK